MERRRFLQTLGAGLGAAGVTTIFDPGETARVEAATGRVASLVPEEVARDESYWRDVQQAFSISRSLIDLNNGYTCPSPRVVTESLIDYIWQQEEAPSYVLRSLLPPRRETVRNGLARLFGCDPEEIALVRNTSEAMEILLLGIDLKSGDEVVTTTQDYGRMRTTLDQRQRREGIEIKYITIPTPARTMNEIVENFRGAITARTKMILMSHQINLTGQILPVKEVCDIAREHGIEVMVDGAHSFAQFAFKREELGCDYFGTSLHKWLLAPKGTGMLFVRRDKIEKIWPLMAAPESMNADIRKFEEIGTHSLAPYLATGEALAFHNAIGSDRKEARLRYLKDYWAKRLMELPNVRLHTSLDPQMSCAIGNVEITNVAPDDLVDYFWDRHHIIVTAINHDEYRGLRITPNLYTTMDELDYFCEVFEQVARRGLPKSA
ncbi:MAG TPA: aminotransferase class V-fold PLP-dependent enzyme [Vicinamibacteria bacterium]|nr:aminotransferase class V-fold PLP-dependent enzyme [Vicinamibacteria bacterium]